MKSDNTKKKQGKLVSLPQSTVKMDDVDLYKVLYLNERFDKSKIAVQQEITAYQKKVNDHNLMMAALKTQQEEAEKEYLCEKKELDKKYSIDLDEYQLGEDKVFQRIKKPTG